MRGPSSRVRKNLVKGVLPLGILASAGVVWQSSYAAFSGTTSDAGNSWTAGTVNLSNSGSGATALSLTNLKPGVVHTSCITVTYGGSLAANTRLYVAPGDLGTSTAPNNLAQYVTLQVDEGTGGDPSCAGFVAAANDYNSTYSPSGTLADFASTDKDFATGAGAWAPASGDTRTYRFTWEVQSDNAAQGLNTKVKFTWEAQNS